MIWCCPICRGELVDDAENTECRACGHIFGRVDCIPDLRVAGPSWIDLDEDRRRAAALVRMGSSLGVAGLLRRVYGARGWDAGLVDLRTRQVLSASDRLAREIDDWLYPVFAAGGPVLDLGCGTGALIVAAKDRPVLGIDVSMTWLVVAARLIRAYGGRPVLAAAMAEKLPLPDSAVAGVVALDVIEHVGDPVACLREIDRVTRTGGHVALATPNRFSLTAEPHVFVWGVGWLPRRWQGAYVRWRTHKDYTYTRLFSTMEIKRLVKRHTALSGSILIPPVPDTELERFSPSRARLARLYNRSVRLGWLRPLLLVFAPFFHVLAVKRVSD